MRILQVYPYYPPAWEYGGAPRVVYRTANTLARHGHDLTVYTSDSAGSEGRITESSPVMKEGVAVYYFTNVSNTLARQHHITLPLGLRSTLRESIQRFDIVHIHGYPHILAWLSARAAQRHSIPYVITPHGTINRPGETSALGKQVFSLLFGRSILSEADRIIALTGTEKNRLVEFGLSSDRIVQVPNGVSSDQQATAGEGQLFRATYGLEDCWIVAFVGRLHPSKGLDLFLSVAERLENVSIDGKPIRFAIIGPDDGYQSELNDRAESLDTVHVLGFLSEDDKNAALTAADVFMLPSRGEGQPMSVLEACASATPVLISEECSLPEVSEYGAGKVLPLDPEQLTESVRTVLENPDERERMERRSREMIDAEFSWDAVATRLETLYRSCLS